MSEPPVASPTSRCSVETYSSSISVANCWAVVIADSESRESCGVEFEPVTLDSRSSRCCASVRMVEGSTPTASSSGAAMPSFCVSNAINR